MRNSNSRAAVFPTHSFFESPSMNRSILLCILAITPLMGETTFDDQATLREFKNEYSAASRKLRAFYSNLRMSGTETYEKDTKNWEFCGNGQSLRSVVQHEDGTSVVFVANENLSFDLKKPAGSSQFAVKMLGSASPAEFAELERAIRRKTTPSNAAFAMLTDPIDNWLEDKDFRFVDAHESNGPEGRIVKVDWKLSAPGVSERVGTFDFAADGSWAFRAGEFHYDHKDPNSGQVWRLGQHVVVEYDGQKDGIPLVKRVRRWGSGPGGKSPETVWEVTELVPGPVPQPEFELAAFGISTAPVGEPTPVAYFLLALSALAGLMVLVFRYLQRRTEKSSSPA